MGWENVQDKPGKLWCVRKQGIYPRGNVAHPKDIQRHLEGLSLA